MDSHASRFWVDRRDWERLASAKHVCYLIGSYDGQIGSLQVLEAAANLNRLGLLSDLILPVQIIHWRNADDHRDVSRRHRNLFRDAAAVYYAAEHEVAATSVALSRESQLVELPGAPAALSQILTYGRGFLTGRLQNGELGLDRIESLEAWLRGGQSPTEDERPLLALGQEVRADLPWDKDTTRLSRLLARCWAVGVADRQSGDVLAGELDARARPTTFVSGDDAAAYLVQVRWLTDQNEMESSSASSVGAGERSLCVGVDVTTTESADEIDELVELVASVRGASNDTDDDMVVRLLRRDAAEGSASMELTDSMTSQLQQRGFATQAVDFHADVVDGCPHLGGVDVTLALGPDVAEASALCSVPTVTLHQDDGALEQFERLRRSLRLSGDVLPSLPLGSEEVRQVLKTVLRNPGLRLSMAAAAREAALCHAANDVRSTQKVWRFLLEGHVAGLERERKDLIERMRPTIEQLTDLQFEYERLLTAIATKADGGTNRNRLPGGSDSELLDRILDAVLAKVPGGATVLVVSKGDEALVDLPGRRGWHFPRTARGVYAGHYPADSAAAIAHLEELRAKGAGYLLFPAPAFWWLEHYAEFRRHLDQRYRRVWDDDTCLVYQLGTAPQAIVKTPRAISELWARVKPMMVARPG